MGPYVGKSVGSGEGLVGTSVGEAVGNMDGLCVGTTDGTHVEL